MDNSIKTRFKIGHKLNIGRPCLEVTKNKIALALKGNKNGIGSEHIITNEIREKLRKSHIGIKLPNKAIQKLKNYWNKPENKQKMKERRAKQITPLKDTSIELKIQNFLKQLGITFLTHQYMKEIEHGYQCDILIPSMNLIIECDGNYWHSYPAGTDIDHIRTKELIKKGFKVLRLWEKDIKLMNIRQFCDILQKY